MRYTCPVYFGWSPHMIRNWKPGIVCMHVCETKCSLWLNLTITLSVCVCSIMACVLECVCWKDRLLLYMRSCQNRKCMISYLIFLPRVCILKLKFFCFELLHSLPKLFSFFPESVWMRMWKHLMDKGVHIADNVKWFHCLPEFLFFHVINVQLLAAIT